MSGRSIEVPWLEPPPVLQPAWVWMPITVFVFSWMIGEPELPPVVSTA
jgi:hypothetical protein